MKRFLILLTAAWLLCPTINYGSETAHARLYCESLRFQQGTTFGGTLDLSTIVGPPFNGELAPYSGNTRGSSFALNYGGLGNINGVIYVDLPLGVDANGNGFDDFFEVAQGVTTTVTSGSYSTDISSGTVTATWSRSAGSKDGTCQLDLNDDTYGDLGTYICPFTVLEYTGPLTYTPGSNTVSATISLAQTGNSANTLQGPVTFVKSSTDHFNTLTNQPGVWTNTALQTLSFDSEIFSRGIPTWPTNYIGYVFFADGDPTTASSDYQLWVLSIDDTNDANANGIPDFSDDPASVTPPRVPHLSLALGKTNLLLTISGSVGHTNQIQEIGSLTLTNWQTTLAFLLTNDPQVISLPLPAGTSKFWRVTAQ
jgi:hypothetical protein